MGREADGGEGDGRVWGDGRGTGGGRASLLGMCARRARQRPSIQPGKGGERRVCAL